MNAQCPANMQRKIVGTTALSALMRYLKEFLFGKPRMPLWRYALLAFPLSLLPSVVISMAIYGLFWCMGVDLNAFESPLIEEVTLKTTFFFLPSSSRPCSKRSCWRQRLKSCQSFPPAGCL